MTHLQCSSVVSMTMNYCLRCKFSLFYAPFITFIGSGSLLFLFLLISALAGLTRRKRSCSRCRGRVSCPSPSMTVRFVFTCAAGSVSISFDFFVEVLYVCSCFVLSRLSNKEMFLIKTSFVFIFSNFQQKKRHSFYILN